MGILGVARQLKHRAFVIRQGASRSWANWSNAVYDHLRPYRFDSARYPLSFVSLPDLDEPPLPSQEVPRQIFVVWAGDNEMSQNRKDAIRSIRERNPELAVHLVTPDNLDDYIVPGYPLHPSYEKLSFVHRSDFLHSYLLHHHGGGYTGVKKHPTAWAPAFDQLESDPAAWIVGYQIPSVREATWIDGQIGRDVHRHYTSLIGTGGMVARAGSPLTQAWRAEAWRRLDYYQDLLERVPGNAMGDNPGYPIPWTTLGSQILEPLCLKYLEHVRINNVVKPQLWGHR